ncbi:copper chaperone PCu(A)C [Ramlibacter humi]|uniref:Copper chaperone PCu(A)C n=1 Tax=Ramlibacter humi TaxID=2530451 RepID=A0A4Z0BVM6_9BURK|nr:copper chaperone PCu(A)C [Ramlibacter humi]TFZ02059.1 copper chaperone PCu(A)C [Ramlibacter humi]
MKKMKTLLAGAMLLAAAGAFAQASAPVTVTAPWARATVQGQRASGAFMTLVPAEALTLVGVSTPVAGVAEVHEMKMEGDVMRMRAVQSVPLPANQPFQLKPGGYHLMLQELKAPLAPNTSIPVTLSFRTAKGEARQLTVQVPVSTLPPKEAGVVGAEPHKH